MKYNHTEKGMGMVEMIVAISVLIMSVLGPIALATRGLHAANDAQNELAATYLATEALEIVHNYRDNNSAVDYSDPIDHSRWLDGIASTTGPLLCAGTNGCIVDPANLDAPRVNDVWGSNTFVPCSTLKCVGGSEREDTIYINPNTGFYRQSLSNPGSPWQKTGLRRRVKLTITDLGHARVDVEADYPVTGGVRTVKLSDDVYNWFFTF